MEPKENPVPNTSNANQAAVDDLHAEGIDVVAGSGVSEDYESSNNTAGPSETREEPVAEATTDKTDEMIIYRKDGAPPVSTIPKTESAMPEPAKRLIDSFVRPSGMAPTPTPTATQTPTSKTEPAVITGQDSGVPVAKNDPSIKPLRTFKSDAEEAVRYQNVSAAQIAIAEAKKREKNTPIEYPSDKKSSAGIIFAVTLIIITAAGGGWYWWYLSSQENMNAPVTAINIRTILPYQKAQRLTLETDSDPLELVAAKLASSNAGLGNIFALIPIAGQLPDEPAPVTEILKNSLLPNRLERSLDKDYMIGTYAADAHNPFLILKNTFFQNAFSGMLEWEKDMREGLIALIRMDHPEEAAINAEKGAFEDIVISNIDARALKNAEGTTILSYAFADKNTIVIATDESTLKRVLDKLLSVRTIQ